MYSPRSIARALALAGTLVAGCSTVRREVVVSAHHPANPTAVEAPLPTDSTTLAVEPVATPAHPGAGTPAHSHTHPPATGGPADPQAEDQ